ncbi:MAG: hypothetical protein IJI46_01920 [Erysipelotrichaceae bacterium]|nr:hypothetical protein [Erysipelotrichaceae bacterium]
MKTYLQGLKSLREKNVILVILTNILNQYCELMKNAFRSLYVVKEVGISPTVFGTALSVCLIATVLFRPMAGNAVFLAKAI